MVKTNQDIIDEHPIRNDDGVPAIIWWKYEIRLEKLLCKPFEHTVWMG